MIGNPSLFGRYIKIDTTDPEKRLEGKIATIVPTDFFDIFTEGGKDAGKMHPPMILPEEEFLVTDVFGDLSYNGRTMREIINDILGIYYTERKVRAVSANKEHKRLDKKQMMTRKNSMPYEMHLLGTAEFLATHLGGPPFDDYKKGLIIAALEHDTIEDLPISLEWAFFNIDRFTEILGPEVMKRIVVMTNFYKHIMPEVDRRMGESRRLEDVSEIVHKMFAAYEDIEEELGAHSEYISREMRELRFVTEHVGENPGVVEKEREITAYDRVRRYIKRATHSTYAAKIVEHDKENDDLVSLVKICDILHNTSTPDGDTEDKVKLIRKNLDYLDALGGILVTEDSEYKRAFSRVAGLTLDLAREQMQKCIDSADPTGHIQDELRPMFVRLIDYGALVLKLIKFDPVALRAEYGLNSYMMTME